MTHMISAVRRDRSPTTSWEAAERMTPESMTLEDSLTRIKTRLRWYGFEDWFIAGAAVTDTSTVSAALADRDGRAFVVMNVDRGSGTIRPTVLDLSPLRQR